MDLKQAIEILKAEQGAAQLELSNGCGNSHTQEFVNALDVVFNFMYDLLQVAKTGQ